MRLAVLAAHPVQYTAPLMRELARRVDLHVFYGALPSPAAQGTGFGIAFAWDVDLLSRYSHSVLPAAADRAGEPCAGGTIAARLAAGGFDAVLTLGWYTAALRQGIRAARRLDLPVLVRGDSQLPQAGATRRADAAKAVSGTAGRASDAAFGTAGGRVGLARAGAAWGDWNGADGSVGTAGDGVGVVGGSVGTAGGSAGKDGGSGGMAGSDVGMAGGSVGTAAGGVGTAAGGVGTAGGGGGMVGTTLGGTRAAGAAGAWSGAAGSLLRGAAGGAAAAGKGALKAALYPFLMRAFAAALPVGSRNAAFYRHHHFPAARLFPSPHAVDTAFFAAGATAAAGAALRAAHGIAPDTRLVLFAGKLVAFKRPLDVIDAAARLGDVALLVAGAGPLEAALRARAAAAGVALHALGFVNQSAMPAVYAAADVLALPSTGRETWGLVANEALAAGTPVVVSEAAGCAPDLCDGRAGLAYPCGDVAALAAALGKMLAGRDAEAIAARSAAHALARAADGVMAALDATARRRRGATPPRRPGRGGAPSLPPGAPA